MNDESPSQLLERAAELSEAFQRLSRMVATDSRDWSLDRGDAWIYGLFCGWGCEDGCAEHDDICGGDGAMREIQALHGWGDEDVERLRRYRKAVRFIQEDLGE